MKILVEDVRYQTDHSFDCFHFKDHRFDCGYHIHPEFELTLIHSGRGYRLTGDHFGHFEPGDLILHGSNLPHLYQNWENDSSESHSQYVQFKISQLINQDLPEYRSIQKMFRKAERGLLFPQKEVQFAQEHMDRIEQSGGAARIAHLILLLEGLSNVKDVQQLASVGYRINQDAKKTERLQRVLSFLDDNFDSKIELADAAQIACLHPQSFSRFFTQQMGKSFQNYLKELRLGYAAREVLLERKSITEIAFDAGFSNLSNFNRLFKKQYGESPSTYLKKVKA